MHKNVTDIEGQRFGQLIALWYVGKRKWLCKCDCGNETVVRGTYLRSGHTVSCGCLRIKGLVERSATHGLTGTKVYRAWGRMKTRCYNPNYHGFEGYQERGTVICDRWFHSFESFYEDMGEPPTPKHTLERIDNDGPYSPDNCRWATQREQGRNTGVTMRLTYAGETKPLVEWAEIFGLNYTTLRARILRHKWPVGKALTTPVRKHNGHR